MAHKRGLSDKDALGNRFITFPSHPEEQAAALPQTSLRDSKNTAQTQILNQNDGGGNFGIPGNPTKSTTPAALTGRLASNTKETGVKSFVDNIVNLGDEAAFSLNKSLLSEDNINTARNKTNAQLDEARNTAIQAKEDESFFTKASRFTIAGQIMDTARNYGKNLQNTADASEARSRVPNLGNQTLADLNREVKVEQDEFGTVIIGGARQQTIQEQINQEPEKGYRSTGNPRGSRSRGSDVSVSVSVNEGEGNRGGLEGPTTRGPSPSMDTNSDMGFGGDGDTGPGSGPPGSEGQGNI